MNKPQTRNREHRTCKKPHRDCSSCGNALYVGDKGVWCDERQEIVMEDWMPTEAYRADCGRWVRK